MKASKGTALKNKQKWVYFFGVKSGAEGAGLSKDILGGKGLGLAEMIKIGLPVPAGFTVTIDAARPTTARERYFPRAWKSRCC